MDVRSHRTRSRPTVGPTKSPVRNKSPKSSGRKSPARRSPARKSPVRDTTKKAITTENPKISPTTTTLVQQETINPIKNPSEPSNVTANSTPEIRKLTVNIMPMNQQDQLSTSSSSGSAKLMGTTTTTSASSVTTTTTTTTTTLIKKKQYLNQDDDDEVKRIISKNTEENVPFRRYTESQSSSINNARGTSVTTRSSKSRSYFEEKNYSNSEDDDYREDSIGGSGGGGGGGAAYNKYITSQLIKEEIDRLPVYTAKFNRMPNDSNLQEFGGNIGALFCILITVMLCIFCQYQCTVKNCSFLQFDWIPLKSLNTYFNLKCCCIYFGYVWFTYILGMMPLGKTVQMESSDGNTIEYYFNGIITTFCIVLGIGISEFLNYPIIQWILQYYQEFCFLSIVHSLIISLWCFLQANYVRKYLWNPYAKSGKIISDYFIGRLINPRWFNMIDIKLVHYRLALITTFIISGMFMYKNVILPTSVFQLMKTIQSNDLNNASTTPIEIIYNYGYNIKLNSIGFISATFICIHTIVQIVKEHQISSSFDVQSEGVGAHLLLRYATYPFFNTLIAKYTYEQKFPEISYLYGYFIVAFVIYSIGEYIKIESDNLKYSYRLNPITPEMLYLDTIPTFQGRRLLVCGFWAFVRNPNYLGEIIINIAFMFPLLIRFAWPPFIAIIYTIILLTHRAKRVNNRNSNRYNSSWTRYCQRVKYMLIPRIY